MFWKRPLSHLVLECNKSNRKSEILTGDVQKPTLLSTLSFCACIFFAAKSWTRGISATSKSQPLQRAQKQQAEIKSVVVRFGDCECSVRNLSISSLEKWFIFFFLSLLFSPYLFLPVQPLIIFIRFSNYTMLSQYVRYAVELLENVLLSVTILRFLKYLKQTNSGSILLLTSSWFLLS